MTKKLVVLGGGTAGWMAANLIAKLVPQEQVSVTVIESADIGIVGVGEGSTPTLKRFFELIDVSECDWMPQCNATYKVNIRFTGWSPESGISDYSHPFISQVDTFTERAFAMNCMTRRLGLDTQTAPQKFLLAGVLAAQNKGPLTPAHFPFRMEYGYHFDSYLLGGFLKSIAIENGVTHIEGTVGEVKQHPSEDIAGLVLCNQETIEGDFFIDCTGFSSLLMQQTLNVEFDSFAENLFNNAAVVIPTAAQEHLPVETTASALSNGWAWSIPLRNRTGNGYVFSDSFLSPDAAEAELRRHLGVDEHVSARHLKMRVGQLKQHWVNNCLGLGLSQGFIEPLEATALHLVQTCIEMFIDDWKDGDYCNKNQKIFNQKTSERFERVRDYIVAHYKLNTRNDSEYWRANRNNEKLSDSLKHILNAWFTRGDLNAEIQRQQLESHFGATSWHCLLSGYGTYPPIAEKQPGTGDLYIEKDIESFLAGCALNFDSHRSNLAI